MTSKIFSSLVTIFFLMGLQQICSQSLITDVPQLNFGTVDETTPTVQQISIENVSDEAIRVIDIQFFDTYDTPAFYTDESEFVLLKGEQKNLSINFLPLHNIKHNTEMFIVTENRGAYSVDLIGDCKYSIDYYKETHDLKEESLKNKLTQITSNNTVSLGYGEARDKMYMEIDNKRVNGQNASTNTIECVYTGEIITGYDDRGDLQSKGFDCEHTWPQSQGASGSPMKSDMHHLFPTNSNANSKRSSSPLGNVENPDWEVGGSKSGNNTFEPRDKQKGISGRALLYFALRYDNTSSVSHQWLTNQEATLRNWSNSFPPTEAERKRNVAIYDYQNNRNPLVDYPQFLERIQKITSSSSNNVTDVEFSDEFIDFGSVQVNQETDFAFAIYNDGNTDITLSNFELDLGTYVTIDSEISSTVTLKPGEDFSIIFEANQSEIVSVYDKFTFNTNVAGKEDVEIPVFVNYNSSTQTLQLPDIELYPNPANDYLNVNILNTNLQSSLNIVSIYSISGQEMFKSQMTNTNFTIPLNEFNNGLYIIKIDPAGYKSNFKTFVVQK